MIEVHAISNAEVDAVDLALFECGVESRSVAVADALKGRWKKAFAISNPGRKSLRYQENIDFFSKIDVEVVEVEDSALEADVRMIIDSHLPNGGVVSLDISCFTRSRLAKIVSVLLDRSEQERVSVLIGYALAKFTSPPGSLPVNKLIGPVHRRFSGKTADSLRPIATMVGLGYEQDKALGSVEYLQSDNNWIFIPHSPEGQYLDAVRESNSTLLELVGGNRCINYDVLDAAYTFSLLESSISDLSRESKLVVLPFGPKIFFVLCLLCAANHQDVGVWYVSGDDQEALVDRDSANHISFARVSIIPDNDQPLAIITPTS